MIFRFQQFEVLHSKSSMRVGTDAVLLGGILSKLVESNERIDSILDIGTGCGVIALIAAQKFQEANITAIDIDLNSYLEAKENFENSPWSNRLQVKNISLQELSKQSSKYNLIISNPPYFENSLKTGKASKDIARHNDSLPFNTLALCVEKLLDDVGKFICILPEVEARKFISIATIESLHCNRIVEIFSKQGDKNPKRLIMCFQKQKRDRLTDSIIIGDDMFREYVSDLLLIQEG